MKELLQKKIITNASTFNIWILTVLMSQAHLDGSLYITHVIQFHNFAIFAIYLTLETLGGGISPPPPIIVIAMKQIKALESTIEPA